MNNKTILNFFFELGHLKRIRHEGIRLAGVERPESVAAHVTRACQIGFLLAELEQAEANKVTAMLVWHDLGECRINDIHKLAERYVHPDESAVVADQTKPLEAMGDAIRELCSEFEHGSGVIRQIAKDADRLEHALTANEYVMQGYLYAQRWIDNTAPALKTEGAKNILAECKKLHPLEWSAGLSIHEHSKKTAPLPNKNITSDTLRMLNFMNELSHLKRIKHEGWRLTGAQPDSVAEHTLRAAQIGYVLAHLEKYEDPNEVATMIVFHDIGEIRIGDIHKLANRYVEDNEEQAVADQTAPLGKIGEKIKTLFTRFENRENDKAGQIAKDADYLEMAFMAQELIEQGYASAQDWINNIEKALTTESAKSLLNDLPTVKSYDWWQGLKKLDI